MKTQMQSSITPAEFDAALKEIEAEQLAWRTEKQRQSKSALQCAIWIGEHLECTSTTYRVNRRPKGTVAHLKKTVAR